MSGSNHTNVTVLAAPTVEEAIKAAETGNVALVEAYLAQGHDINDRLDDRARTLATIAAESGQTDLLRNLSLRGANLSTFYNYSSACQSVGDPVYEGSALQHSISRGDDAVAIFLIEENADINRMNTFNLGVGGHDDAFMLASCMGRIEVLKKLCSKYPDHDLNAHADQLGSAIMLAAEKGHFEVVKFLHEKGVALSDQFDTSAFACAAYAGSVPIMAYLQGVAPIDIRHDRLLPISGFDLSPSVILTALSGGHTKAVKWLIAEADYSGDELFGLLLDSLLRCDIGNVQTYSHYLDMMETFLESSSFEMTGVQLAQLTAPFRTHQRLGEFLAYGDPVEVNQSALHNLFGRMTAVVADNGGGAARTVGYLHKECDRVRTRERMSLLELFGKAWRDYAGVPTATLHPRPSRLTAAMEIVRLRRICRKINRQPGIPHFPEPFGQAVVLFLGDLNAKSLSRDPLAGAAASPE